MSSTSFLFLVIFSITFCILSHGFKFGKPTGNKQSTTNFQKCKLWEITNDRKVCVCNSNYCDTIPKPEKIQKPNYYFYTSNKQGLRFSTTISKFHRFTKTQNQNKIYINSSKKFQKILGFGGAFSDSTGINIQSLDEKAQDLLLKSYFSEDGLEYNLCRVPIGGTDFSTRLYTYDDSDTPDPELKKFQLAPEDYKYKIPFIRKALKLTNNNLKLFGSTWGAPVWMKTEQNVSTGYIKREYYGSWAKYFIKFFEEYEKNGIEFWGITTQNEPSLTVLDVKLIPSVGWLSIELAKWVRYYLGPTIKTSPFKNVKIMILDDQKVLIPWYVNSVLASKETQNFVSGIALHWYFGVLTPCSAQNALHDNFPDIFLISTEACNGFQGSSGVLLGSWERGELYSTDMIENFNCWIVGWVDWNMVLDVNGGPTLIDNNVDAPIVVDSKKGEFYKQPMYYHLAHHSKFVPENSVRIDSNSTILNKNFTVAAYLRPDNGTAVVILNKNEEDLDVVLVDESAGVANLRIDKKSINTILYW